MKKILFLALCSISYILSTNINTELNQAIQDSDYDTVVQIFKEKQLSEKEKIMYFDLANDIYKKRIASGSLIQTVSGDFRVMNEYEMKEHDKATASKVLYASLLLASFISTGVSLIVACVPTNRSEAIISAALASISLSTLVYSCKKLNDIEKNIAEILKELKENSLKIRQFIILSIDTQIEAS